MFVFIAHADADEAAAGHLKAFLKKQETGAQGFWHRQDSDVVVALWLQKSVFGTHRMTMKN
jgi:hypothetical protein